MSGVAPEIATESALRSPMDATRPSFFSDPGIDQLYTMVLELAAEIVTMRERLFAIEAVADERGFDFSRAVESWRPAPDQERALEAIRKRMMQHLFRTVAQAD